MFAGAAQIDGYAAFLQRELALLWIVRIILIVSVVLHIAAAYQLAIASRGARRVRYAELEPQSATIASRTMRVGGVAIAAFIVFHLVHLTTGMIRHAPFSPAHVHANLVGGFRVWWVAAIAQHRSQQEAASIHAIAGIVRLGLPARTVDLLAGRLLVLAPGLAHDGEAVADSAFLLTLARGAQS